MTTHECARADRVVDPGFPGRDDGRYQIQSISATHHLRFPGWLRTSMQMLALTLLAVVSLGGVETDGDAWRAWLEKPSEKRLTQLEEQTRDAQKVGHQWLAAWCFTLSQPVGEQRLLLLDRLAKLPAPGNAAAYLRLERAHCWIATKQINEAIDVANEERQRQSNDPRLRFDACLILAEALDAGNRVDEANAVRREADDLAKRMLYADPGVNPAQVHRPKVKKLPTEKNTDPAEWYALAEKKRKAGQYMEAEDLYKSVVIAIPDDRLAPASMVGLGWCRIALGDETGGLLHWIGLIDKTPSPKRKNQREPAPAPLGASGPNSRGPFRGQALLALVEHAVTTKTDPVSAQRWLDCLDEILAHGKPSDQSWDSILRKARLHRIILHLTFNREAKAIEVAKELSADPDGADTARVGEGKNQYTPARGAMRLAQQLTAGEPLTPAPALAGGTPTNNLRILMADAWAIMEQRDHARPIWNVVLDDKARPTPNQRAYVRMRLADAEREEGHFDYFRMGFTQVLADQPRNPWAPRQRLCLAIDDIGRRNDRTSGLQGFREVVDRYPASEQARTACWYMGIVHLFHGNWLQADQAWTELDQRWPNHPWRDVINNSYRPMLREAQRTGTWPVGLPRAAGAAKVERPSNPRTP